jgi:hypothetical protein
MIRPVLGLVILASAAGLAVAAVDVSRDPGRSARAAKSDRLPLVETSAPPRSPGVTSTSFEDGDVLVVRDEGGRDLIRIDRARGVTTVGKGLVPSVASDAIIQGDACGAEGPCPAESGA